MNVGELLHKLNDTVERATLFRETEQLLYIPRGFVYIGSRLEPSNHAKFLSSPGFQGIYSLVVYPKKRRIVFNQRLARSSEPTHGETKQEDYVTVKDAIKLLKLFPVDFKLWASIDNLTEDVFVEIEKFQVSYDQARLGSSLLHWT